MTDQVPNDFAASSSFACRAVRERRQVLRLPRRSGAQTWKSFLIRNSAFLIAWATVMMIFRTYPVAMAETQSSSLIGGWNVEIAFGDGNKRALRFDAQSEGKGTFLVLDPRSKAWEGPGKPSEAKWTRGDGNSVTFAGPVEFMLGNVGRDAGTLTFKGKFETPDTITGEVDFAPLVGDRLTRHGTFKATRSKD